MELHASFSPANGSEKFTQKINEILQSQLTWEDTAVLLAILTSAGFTYQPGMVPKDSKNADPSMQVFVLFLGTITVGWLNLSEKPTSIEWMSGQ